MQATMDQKIIRWLRKFQWIRRIDDRILKLLAPYMPAEIAHQADHTQRDTPQAATMINSVLEERMPPRVAMAMDLENDQAPQPTQQKARPMEAFSTPRPTRSEDFIGNVRTVGKHPHASTPPARPQRRQISHEGTSRRVTRRPNIRARTMSWASIISAVVIISVCGSALGFGFGALKSFAANGFQIGGFNPPVTQNDPTGLTNPDGSLKQVCPSSEKSLNAFMASILGNQPNLTLLPVTPDDPSKSWGMCVDRQLYDAFYKTTITYGQNSPWPGEAVSGVEFLARYYAIEGNRPDAINQYQGLFNPDKLLDARDSAGNVVAEIAWIELPPKQVGDPRTATTQQSGTVTVIGGATQPVIGLTPSPTATSLLPVAPFTGNTMVPTMAYPTNEPVKRFVIQQNPGLELLAAHVVNSYPALALSCDANLTAVTFWFDSQNFIVDMSAYRGYYLGRCTDITIVNAQNAYTGMWISDANGVQKWLTGFSQVQPTATAVYVPTSVSVVWKRVTLPNIKNETWMGDLYINSVMSCDVNYSGMFYEPAHVYVSNNVDTWFDVDFSGYNTLLVPGFCTTVRITRTEPVGAAQYTNVNGVYVTGLNNTPPTPVPTATPSAVLADWFIKNVYSLMPDVGTVNHSCGSLGNGIYLMPQYDSEIRNDNCNIRGGYPVDWSNMPGIDVIIGNVFWGACGETTYAHFGTKTYELTWDVGRMWDAKRCYGQVK